MRVSLRRHRHHRIHRCTRRRPPHYRQYPHRHNRHKRMCHRRSRFAEPLSNVQVEIQCVNCAASISRKPVSRITSSRRTRQHTDSAGQLVLVNYGPRPICSNRRTSFRVGRRRPIWKTLVKCFVPLLAVYTVCNCFESIHTRTRARFM